MSQTVHITGLSYGAHGVGRVDGKVVFVRHVVPGEDVEVEIREDHGSYAYAEALRILDPAAGRRLAPCPYLPRCGGCPWQHMNYDVQLRAKEQNLRDHLARTAHLPDVDVVPIIGTGAEFGYRSRLSLRIAGGEVGFYAAASHDLVPIENCLLADSCVNDRIHSARELVRLLQSPVRRLEIVHGSDEPGVVFVGEVEGEFCRADDHTLASWLRVQPCDAVRGVVLHGRRWRRRWGDDLLTVRPLPGEPLRVRAGLFAQVNPRMNEVLVRTVLDLAAPSPGLRVLDLYAGTGNFSLPLARRGGAVVAVEQNPLAAEDARDNATRAGLQESLRVVRGNARRVIDDLRAAKATFDLIILDPPRNGAAEIVPALLELRTPVLIYVSCNPATLARDLRGLAAAYRIDFVQPIDLFPQTYHAETVVRCVLT